MTSNDEAPGSAAPSLLTALTTGILRQELFGPFPEQPAADRAVGRSVAEELDKILGQHLDSAGDEAPLSEELLADLRDHGYFRLQNAPEIGGRGLSAYTVFRLVERIARRSVPASQLVAAQLGIGAAAMEPALNPGGLRDFLRERIAAGMVSGMAFTEPSGRNNLWPATTATLSADGAHYVLQGEKVFIMCAPVADVLAVTATEGTGASRRYCLCFVETRSPGFTLTAHHEFTGSRGLPVGALRLDRVRVPAELVLSGPENVPGFPESVALLNPLMKLGELYVNVAPALAIAKNCLRWTREFVARRHIDGRPLGDREQICRFVELSLAEVYALESVVRWALLGAGPEERWLERHLVKNLTVRIAGRLVDRTMGVLGGEGVETVTSMRARGSVPTAVERAFRDVRLLRVMGNIDFRADYLVMRQLLAAFPTGADVRRGKSVPRAGALSEENQVHLATAGENVDRFAAAGAELNRHLPDPAWLDTRQQAVTLLGRVAGELFATCAVLARTQHLAAGHDDAAAGPDTTDVQALADVYCADAEHRIAGLWRRFAAEHVLNARLDNGTGRESVAERWLTGRFQDHAVNTTTRLDTNRWPPTPAPSTSI